MENLDYLLHLYRYIHSNPVKDGFVDHLEDWPYSNSMEWIGVRFSKLVDRGFVKEHFPYPPLPLASVLIKCGAWLTIQPKIEVRLWLVTRLTLVTDIAIIILH